MSSFRWHLKQWLLQIHGSSIALAVSDLWARLFFSAHRRSDRRITIYPYYEFALIAPLAISGNNVRRSFIGNDEGNRREQKAGSIDRRDLRSIPTQTNEHWRGERAYAAHARTHIERPQDCFQAERWSICFDSTSQTAGGQPCATVGFSRYKAAVQQAGDTILYDFTSTTR